MAKRGIWNDQTFRGRWKGNTDGRVSNPDLRERWDNMHWGKTYWFCKECNRYIDLDRSCSSCGAVNLLED